MRVLQNDPPRAEIEGSAEFVTLQQVAEESDVISLHTPLTYDGKCTPLTTFKCHFIAQLERHPLLINACRGAVADSEALLEGFMVHDATLLDCCGVSPGSHQSYSLGLDRHASHCWLLR